MRLSSFLLALVFASTALSSASVDIPFEQFTLPNGLRVVVHSDHKAPIIAVNVWYHVGSKDEPAGKSGFAHLFEHLMFQSSENHKGEYFDPFKQVGATDQNGTTNLDRTNYFQNVPTTALDTALFMESDRMGHLLGAIHQAGLDEQRGVVQNEKRQDENQPYGRVWEVLLPALYPKGHPYQHSVIGSMNDLNAASLEDVKTWFKSWYGPNNAVLVLAGDIDLATAKEMAAKYFGDIPASATLIPKKPMVAARTKSTRDSMTDKVAQTLILKVWNTPEYTSSDVERLQLFAQILGGSRSSRLDKRLTHKDKLVDQISAFSNASELGGTFTIRAMVKKDIDPALVEKAIQEEMTTLLKDGATKTELDQAKTVFRAGFIRGIEKVGGFGGKSDVLAECTVFTGNPGCFKDQLARIESSTLQQIKTTARKWLSKGDHTLTVLSGEVKPLVEEPSIADLTPAKIPAPDPKFTTLKSAIDRSKGVPIAKQFPDLQFPKLQRSTLSNGLKIIFAARPGVPVIQMDMEFPGGYRSDSGRKAGTAGFAMSMLDEGAGNYDAIALANRMESLGAVVSAGAGLDSSSVELSALKERIDESLALYADVMRRPTFDSKEIERVRATWIANIKQEKTSPTAMIARVMGPLIFGKDHPYGIPMSGTGYEGDISSLSRQDLVAWHKEQIRPDAATLMIVGDTTLAEITPLLEKHLGDWRAEGSIEASTAFSDSKKPTSPRVFLMDQPGAIQATISIAQTVPSSVEPTSLDFDIANGVIGGDFTSRINMNLREDKHWSYGARSSSRAALGQRLWMVTAPVQIDKTVEALKELQREIEDFASGKVPAKADEVSRVQAINILTLPGSLETAGAVLATIGSINRFGRPDDYVSIRRKRIEAMTATSVQSAAKIIEPQSLTWVIVGDLSKIEAGIRSLNIGTVQVIDADGKPVDTAKPTTK